MKQFETLYARNSNGKINQWIVQAYSEADNGVIEIQEGILGGTMTASYRKTKGKNIGKMNETTPYEQACKDAESRWENKKKKGYKSLDDLSITKAQVSADKFLYEFRDSDSIGGISDDLEKMIDTYLPSNRTDANNLTKPMKCQPYFKDDGTPRITFPCYGQTKLNGFRVMARLEKVIEGEGMFREEIIKSTFRSKEGLRYTILEHIEKDIELIIHYISDLLHITSKDIALDGEMYIHNEILSEISSAVRKRNDKTPLIEFHIFDIAVENVPQNKRVTALNHINDLVNSNEFSEPRSFQIVESFVVSNNEEAQKLTDEWIRKGYEGGVFRDMKAIYQFGSRPKTMVKLKRSEDKEFPILDVVPMENAPDLGMFVCKAENGETFTVNAEGSHEIKRDYLSNKDQHIGKKLTVRFFERTKTGVPFHAVGVTIRDYEE